MAMIKNISSFVFFLAITNVAAATATKVAKNLPEPKYMTTLGMVDGEVEDNSTNITIRLDKKPNWDVVPPIESHGNFLQVVIPDTIVPEPGKFFDSGTELVPKIAVFQLTPSNAGVRLFINGDASIAKKSLKAAVVGRRVIISLDQSKINANKVADLSSKTSPDAQNIKQSKEPEVNRAGESDEQIPDFIDGIARVESATSIIARTEVKRDLPPPSLILKGEELSKSESVRSQEENDRSPRTLDSSSLNEDKSGDERRASLGESQNIQEKNKSAENELSKSVASSGLATGNGIDLRQKLVQVTGFIGGMLAILLLSFAFRGFFRKRLRAVSGQDQIDLKMLSSLPLAPRQRLSLVQVGDERILIGVTPENISFIANLSKQAQPYGFGKVLAHTEIEGAEKATVPTLAMSPAPRPKLKDIPGNDESTLGDVVVPRQTIPSPSLPARDSTSAVESRKKYSGSRVNVAVGDDGAREVSPTKRQVSTGKVKSSGAKIADSKPASRESVDDVTKMIRDKLRQLKSI